MSDLLPKAEYKGIKMYTTDAVSTAMKYVDEGLSELSEQEVREKFDFIQDGDLKNIFLNSR